MDFMAKKRARYGRNINVYVDPRIGKALDQYVKDSLPRTTVTAVIEKALMKLFESEGKWPDKKQS